MIPTTSVNNSIIYRGSSYMLTNGTQINNLIDGLMTTPVFLVCTVTCGGMILQRNNLLT